VPTKAVIDGWQMRVATIHESQAFVLALLGITYGPIQMGQTIAGSAITHFRRRLRPIG